MWVQGRLPKGRAGLPFVLLLPSCLEYGYDGRSAAATLKPSNTLWGSWAQEPFCAPHFKFLGNGPPSASLALPGNVLELTAARIFGRELAVRPGLGVLIVGLLGPPDCWREL